MSKFAYFAKLVDGQTYALGQKKFVNGEKVAVTEEEKKQLVSIVRYIPDSENPNSLLSKKKFDFEKFVEVLKAPAQPSVQDDEGNDEDYSDDNNLPLDNGNSKGKRGK